MFKAIRESRSSHQWRKQMGMKYVLATILGFSLCISVCWADEKLELTDQKDKVSYSVGYQMGGDFKRQGQEINPEVLVRGIQDAIKGTGVCDDPGGDALHAGGVEKKGDGRSKEADGSIS